MPTFSISDFERPLALLTRSIRLKHAEQNDEALTCLNDLLSEYPRFLPAVFRRAIMFADMNRYDDALADFDSYLAYQPDADDVLQLRNEILEWALSDLSALVNDASQKTTALFRRGSLFMQIHEYARAINDFTEYLAQIPDDKDALNHIGNALLALNRHEEALAVFERLSSLAPEYSSVWFNRGNVLQQLNRLDEAIQSYEYALQLQPDFPETHMELAHCKLSQENYVEGWMHFEWRWKTAWLKDQYIDSPQPLWLGQTSLRGRTILLWAEQGLGDAIQFVRFVSRVADLAGQVILYVHPGLLPLLSRMDERIHAISHELPLPAHDVHCPLMSLPFALGIAPSLHTMPRRYLCADPERLRAWQTRLGPATRVRVGLAWCGRQYGLRNQSRDIRLALLKPLTDQKIDFISLQKENPPQDTECLGKLPNVRCFSSDLTDFAETAALIECLDLVISVDTSIAHLAGSLGKPCWMLLRYSVEWRWMLERNDSPWYPSLKLYRQPRPGDWTSVIQTLGEDLRELIPVANACAKLE